MDIERLRALEKKWRAAGDAETKRADGDGLSDGEQGWHHGRGEQYDNCADELAALIAELGQEVGAVAWPPRAMRGDDCVVLSEGREILPLMPLCDVCRSDEAGTWNRCLDECQRATASVSGLGISAKEAQGLSRWLEIHYRGNFTIPEIRKIHAALLGVHSSPAHTSEARDAVLKGVRELAIKAAAHWDADEDMKVGKILMALAGQLPKYDKRADAFDAALETSR